MLLHQDNRGSWLSVTSCKQSTANLDWDYKKNLTNKQNHKI